MIREIHHGNDSRDWDVKIVHSYRPWKKEIWSSEIGENQTTVFCSCNIMTCFSISYCRLSSCRRRISRRMTDDGPFFLWQTKHLKNAFFVNSLHHLFPSSNLSGIIHHFLWWMTRYSSDFSSWSGVGIFASTVSLLSVVAIVGGRKKNVLLEDLSTKQKRAHFSIFFRPK
jgi:hypothetical protein